MDLRRSRPRTTSVMLRVGVVDYAGELIAGEAVLAPDEEVTEVFACGEGLRAEVAVFEA